MTTREDTRPADDRPGVAPTVSRCDQQLVRAAARILARHYCPEWRPGSDAELDAWGHGFNAAWQQGYAAGRS